MGNTRSKTINHNSDKGGVAPWLDLNHDLLNLVMMRLGVVDFIAFSGVCKSWRSLTLSNRNLFMVSRPPMYMSVSPSCASKKECILKDFEGRKFKTILPNSSERTCIGLTCGYLILFGRKAHDFWLVNPITRHELYFPDAPFYVPTTFGIRHRAILVFSRSISRWVFVMLVRCTRRIWYSIEGKGVWNFVPSTFPIFDLHAFKGKIYSLHTQRTLDTDYHIWDVGHVCEMSIAPEPKFTPLETKNILMVKIFREFVRSGENLYLLHNISSGLFKFQELDFGEMKWVCCEKKKEKHAFFSSPMQDIVAVNPELWVDPHLHYDRFKYADMWYFPHDCLNVNVIDE